MATTTYCMPIFTRRIDPVFDADRKLIGYDGFLDGCQRVYSAATYYAAEIVLDELSDAQRVIEADLDAETDALCVESCDSTLNRSDYACPGCGEDWRGDRCSCDTETADRLQEMFEDACLDAAARQWSASLCKACYKVHSIQCCPQIAARLMEK